MHFYWMAISSNINFIFEVSESCLIIENLILKKTDIKDGAGVSQDGNIHMIYISRYCSFGFDWSICWPKYYKN